MKLVIPDLDLYPGNMYCLHVPAGYHESKRELEAELMELAAGAGKSLVVSRPAMPSHNIWSWFREQRSSEWLAAAARISHERAAVMIAQFGSPVGEVLARNAGTPRTLLGLAALIAEGTEVIVYSTCGLDPCGILDVHRYASSNRSERCLVHLSIPTFYGDGRTANRYCPFIAECVDLEPSH